VYTTKISQIESLMHCISAFMCLLDQKTLFNHIPSLLHSNLATSSVFFRNMEIFWQKENNCIWHKVDFYPTQHSTFIRIKPCAKNRDKNIQSSTSKNKYMLTINGNWGFILCPELHVPYQFIIMKLRLQLKAIAC